MAGRDSIWVLYHDIATARASELVREPITLLRRGARDQRCPRELLRAEILHGFAG